MEIGLVDIHPLQTHLTSFYSYSVIMQLFVFFHTICQVLDRWKSTCDIIPLGFKKRKSRTIIGNFCKKKGDNLKEKYSLFLIVHQLFQLYKKM